MEIGEWLRRLALQQYEQTFRDNAIDTESLPDLTETDLEMIGVLLGHRKRILRAIEKLAPKVTLEEKTSAPSRSAESGELRQISVLFCDMVGSTELSSRLAPEDLREVLGAYKSCVGKVAGTTKVQSSNTWATAYLSVSATRKRTKMMPSRLSCRTGSDREGRPNPYRG